MDIVSYALAAAVYIVVVVSVALPVVLLVVILKAVLAAGFGSGRAGRAIGVFIALCVFAGVACFIWGSTLAVYMVVAVALALPVVLLVVILKAARAGGFGSGRAARAKGVFIALCVFAGVAFFTWGWAFAIYMKERESARGSICASNTLGLSRALRMYAEEKGVLPSAETWCDDLLPYVEGPETFRCPAAPELTSAFAFNSAISALRLDDIPDPAHVVVIFESDAGWNASGDLSLLAEDARHLRGDNYGFAAGHGGWVHRDRILSADTDYTWSPAVEREDPSSGLTN
jgi:hypothetical protein